MAANFSRLVRFEDNNGKIHHGEAGSDWHKSLVGQVVPTYDIADPFDDKYSLSGHKVEIAKAILVYD